MDAKSLSHPIIIGIVIIISTIIATNSFNGYWKKQAELEEKQLLIEAVDQCGRVATTTWKDTKNDSQVTEPYISAYQKCLRDKGFTIGE